MSLFNQSCSISKPSGVVRAIFAGMLLGLPIVPAIASASPLNPCPGIYYEEPFNSTRAVPQGCPPNAATQKLQASGQTGSTTSSSTETMSSPTSDMSRTTTTTTTTSTMSRPNVPRSTSAAPPEQPPLPETQQSVVATVTPVNGAVSIKLMNQTNTVINYQVLGNTNTRALAAGSEVTLQNLPTPVNVTFVRPDGGFVQVMPRSAGSGALDVMLDAAPTVDAGSGILNVQKDGSVLLN